MNYTLLFGVIATILGLIAIYIAIKQGRIAKEQLDLAKDINNKTENLLENIKEKVTKIETISNDTKNSIDKQILNMINKNDENFKELLKSGKEIDQNQLMTTLLPALLQSPDGLNNLMKMGELVNNKK